VAIPALAVADASRAVTSGKQSLSWQRGSRIEQARVVGWTASFDMGDILSLVGALPGAAQALEIRHAWRLSRQF
jgi:hypothetical protein